MFDGIAEWKRPVESRCRWKDNIKVDAKEM
jgi:hypothetical protein